ncbi:hypothetical protein JCM19037_4321 [Geomicrobium sp. JCM 19037]|uniref:UPF0738 family protein n=1 Tax=Geomicrobium sp. JCM 19037 TaxID=1460634 RepID=UPI00045F43C2|nr:hypothetical protein [Geomicrobium sp. JCM 19037]GAK05792.1 hypothetical protein JCM19037_4321 [Geomicrobium sp. JCM 19037]
MSDIQIDQILITEHRAQMIPKNEEQLSSDCKAAMRMLADSDRLAFVYVIECNGEFQKVHLPEFFWPILADIHQKQVPVYLGNDDIELMDFHDELEMLLDNIPDNNNYGKAMEEAVAKHFLNHNRE